MTHDEVAEVFNHPLDTTQLRRTIDDLAQDPSWTIVAQHEEGETLTLQLLYRPTGSPLQVAQERSLLGLWNSTI